MAALVVSGTSPSAPSTSRSTIDAVANYANKLKDQVQESESHSAILQQKIKELEEKLKEQELQLQCTHDFVDAAKATPAERKISTRDEFMSDIESHILRSSNSLMNRPKSQGSNRGNHSIHERTRRKREFKSGDTENIIMVTNCLNDNRARKSDPSKIARIMRTAKPSTTIAVQGPLTHKRVIRDQVQGLKDQRDAKKKIWSSCPFVLSFYIHEFYFLFFIFYFYRYIDVSLVHYFSRKSPYVQSLCR
ncbi:kinesin-like protein KIN-14R isoform X1 [Ziziphus jujuba]|uniref:Kinesin-like protein KIN-14R isoform X1 n=1 Tax=Ziziphus jujuba TaxID=326968 RepID=A0ABM4A501_ZIZJJ|nr:kinesin-like protein KIN-14R isoform X1 [Ziziphus jujuba]